MALLTNGHYGSPRARQERTYVLNYLRAYELSIFLTSYLLLTTGTTPAKCDVPGP